MLFATKFLMEMNKRGGGREEQGEKNVIPRAAQRPRACQNPRAFEGPMETAWAAFECLTLSKKAFTPSPPATVSCGRSGSQPQVCGTACAWPV